MRSAIPTLLAEPLEALVAAPMNAAYIRGFQDEIGRLEPGLRADLVVLDAPSFEHLVYRPGDDLVVAVVRDGHIAYVALRVEPRLRR